MKRHFSFQWTLCQQCSLQTVHFKKSEQQNQISNGSPCPTLKPSISSSPLFAKSSTISRAKKPICRQQLTVSINQCSEHAAYLSFKTLTMQALLFHLSAFSTNPKVGGLISGVLRGGVTPCTQPKRR